MSTEPIYRARDLKITYQRGRGPLVRAVDGVDLDWRRGETLGLVGESGCGKSTLARSLVGLESPSDGTIEFDGKPVDRDLRALRRRVQLIFQDPYQSMNPRRTVGAQVQEGLAATGMRSGDERLAARGRARCTTPASLPPTASGAATRTSSRAASASAS